MYQEGGSLQGFRRGDQVLVARVNQDDCANEDYVGQSGVIARLLTEGLTGESESDPLYDIVFSDGAHEQYWGEELETTAGEEIQTPANMPECQASLDCSDE